MDDELNSMPAPAPVLAPETSIKVDTNYDPEWLVGTAADPKTNNKCGKTTRRYRR